MQRPAATPIVAAKGMSWMSPRVPTTIDPGTRAIIQTL